MANENKNLNNVPVTHTLQDADGIIITQGNTLKQVPAELLVGTAVEETLKIIGEQSPDGQFYTTPNSPSAKGEKYIKVEGDLSTLNYFCNNAHGVLLDPVTGYYCRLSDADLECVADTGERVYNHETGELNAAYEKAEWMGIIPSYKQLCKTVTVGSETEDRVYVGYHSMPEEARTIPTQCVGMFQAYVSGGKMHSRPGVVPTASTKIFDFWQRAQDNHPSLGLAGVQFRTWCMHKLNAKYGYRSVQEVVDDTGTLVYGPGLDGTENTTGSTKAGLDRQKNIKTGATLKGGKRCGKAAVQDSEGGTCHSVIDEVFENSYGQFCEMCGDLCSLANDEASGNRVVRMLENTMPKNGSTFITAPVLSDFDNIEHEILNRNSKGDMTYLSVANDTWQLLPAGEKSGISDGDNVGYSTLGQLWVFGGAANSSVACGFGDSASYFVWTNSGASISARLAFFDVDNLKETTSAHLKEILASR